VALSAFNGCMMNAVMDQAVSGSDGDLRWQALLARDLRADGTFVYGVSSTRIFCRPSCPSRRPMRDRVTFFDGAADAVAAGFRPCRRCRPDAEASPLVARVTRARAWIDEHPYERPVLEKLARLSETSPWHLQRSFKRLFGVTPLQYAAALRASRLKEELRQGRSPTSALYEAGYGSPSRLYEEADGVLGMSPSAYRRRGAGQIIRFATAECRLGVIIAGVSGRGLCHVSIGASAEELEHWLAAEFPAATLSRDDEGLAPVLQELTAVASGAPAPLAIPLDLRGTSFQRQVWRALRRIPPGQTRTYAQVAEMIKQPGAARAVARACAANPVALAVPCHRVVPTAGGTGGYRWGSARKARLLRAEGA
jgi:AraC family transcriptional regulator of adaptative response/methylated-DNA-[protein]-cysteine methyltransferase